MKNDGCPQDFPYVNKHNNGNVISSSPSLGATTSFFEGFGLLNI
jgi:hypothetical protein